MVLMEAWQHPKVGNQMPHTTRGIPPELCRNVDSAVSIDAAQCMSWLAFEPGVDTPKLIGWGRRWG
jgi:hypothetical protein